jgi:hypothetical protein
MKTATNTREAGHPRYPASGSGERLCLAHRWRVRTRYRIIVTRWVLMPSPLLSTKK